jgi:hypothetical protein
MTQRKLGQYTVCNTLRAVYTIGRTDSFFMDSVISLVPTLELAKIEILVKVGRKAHFTIPCCSEIPKRVLLSDPCDQQGGGGGAVQGHSPLAVS